jgi:biotin transport system substrate-specific component
MKIRPVPFLLALLAVVLIAPFSFNIPLVPIPITAQTLILFGMAVLLPPIEGVLLVVCYLLLGVLGLPVFSGWSSGYEKMIGTTAGFLWAFLPAVWFLSYRLHNKNAKFITAMLLFFAAHLFVLLVGGIWMLRQLEMKAVFEIVILNLLPVAFLKSILLTLFYFAIRFVKKA